MESDTVCLIEQNQLPFKFEVFYADTSEKLCQAIQTMVVRGAGAIGATAGYGMAQAFLQAPANSLWPYVEKAKEAIEATRPTAQNLFYATNRIMSVAKASEVPVEAAIAEAAAIADEDAAACRAIGENGNTLISKGDKIETHCNAGWLAFVDYGSALAPIYAAHHAGKDIFVYADETRPRGQGMRLTAWELKGENVPHAVIADNAGAHLMSHGKIDMVIVGSDRIAANGDVANKIGTLEKAIAAKYYGIPFYVAAPTSTIDPNTPSGDKIPIENRPDEELLYQTGPGSNGEISRVQVCSPGSEGLNPAFDVTPASLVTALITEKGIIKPDSNTIAELLQA